ncbi:MAG: heme-copper oxidase subunit III [Chitinophagales bacterium]
MSETRDKRQLIKNPAIIIVNFLMAGIVLLFVGLAYGYIFTMGSNWLEFKLPKIFWLSTASIISVSILLRSTLKFYDSDKPAKLKRNILAALIMACLFVFCQVSGWITLQKQGIVLDTSPSVSYLYVLTGLHILHVLAGIIFLVVAVVRSYLNTANEVSSLLFFSDPVKRTRLKLLNTYWHTIDFLWVFLFLAFLFHHA